MFSESELRKNQSDKKQSLCSGVGDLNIKCCDQPNKISVGCKAGSTATTRQKVLLDDSGDQPHVKDNEAMTDENKIVQPSRLELENVHKVYNEIANHFSLTRHTPWPQVRTFIEEFDVGSVLVDIGCGNGKYLHLNENIAKIGCDRSDGLLGICRQRGLNSFQCDCLAVPIRSNSVDGVISIAVIHHLATKQRRKQAIAEMARILRPLGRALVYVWAKNQALKEKSCYLRQNKKNIRVQKEDTPSTTTTAFGLPVHTNRTQFVHQDILVPWVMKKPDSKPIDKLDKAEPQDSTFLRYYHVFEENELEKICAEIDGITIKKSYYDQGNWCIIFEKKYVRT